MSGQAAPRRRAAPFVRASLALHAAALPAAAILPARWPWIAGALVADHVALVAAGLAPRSTLLGPNVRRDAAAAAAGAVALTFDDGPDPLVTPRVLELLERYSARASFFCVGSRVEAHPELVAEIVRRGHVVENHSQTHTVTFFFHGPRHLEREIADCQAAVEKATGRVPRFFRAPAGIRSPLLQRVLDRHGLALASWTRRGFDTVGRSSDAVLARLRRDLAAGDVLLLHDTPRRRDSPRPPIVLDVLPRLLDAMAAATLGAIPLSAPAP